MEEISSANYNRQNVSQPMTFNESVVNRSLRCVSELPFKYQSLFTEFQVFNSIQSHIMDDLLLDDKSIVVSAPTGSGKTTLFELAIVRLLSTCQSEEDTESQDSPLRNHKIVYMAPVKALCAERYNDWERKFQCLGLKAIEVTGDSDEGNLLAIQHFNLVLTTPEKWDSLTRKWRDHTSLISVIKLFLIDEVHLLNEDKRGSTLEAVVSRMKAVQESLSCSSYIRFIAVSATIPNIEDVAVWLGKKSTPAKSFKFGEETRPVKLRKIVKSFPFGQGMSYFKFDFNLNYKLRQIILEYSEGKPSLVFCSTRKSVIQTSGILLQNITFHFTQVQKMTLEEASRGLQDVKLKDTVKYGVGYHHAGLVASDRHIVEDLFRSGFLPVLICTSTLAMGVNLPAHLVVIKSTSQYSNGAWEEYSEGQLLQMMGRAGRPQFDSTATAIILTKSSMKERYEKLLVGNQLVESNLHKNLAEHLNSEIVLGTITDIAVALHWLRSTFFYVRALRNPRHYGIPLGLSLPELEARLQEVQSTNITEEDICLKSKDWTIHHKTNVMSPSVILAAMCMRELNGLEKFELIKKTDFAYNVEPTENGKLMARLYIAYETMKIFMKIKGDENLPELIELLCSCHEFCDIKLRVNERTALNLLNINKHQETIRFPLQGRIKTRELKINCLLQAILGCLHINDPSLIQEGNRIFRLAERVTKALSLYLWQKNFYQSLASSLILAKCLSAKMWDNSLFLSRHLPGIGPALASLLVAARKVTFKAISDSNPRDLERILNKHPPFGSNLQEAARRIPQYALSFNYGDYRRMIEITIKLVNANLVKDLSRTSSLLVGDSNNRLIRKEKISDGTLIKHNGIYTISIFVPEGTPWVIAHLISDTLAGVDIRTKIALSSKECVEICSGPSLGVSCDEDSNNPNMTEKNKKKNDSRKQKDVNVQKSLVSKKNAKAQSEKFDSSSSQVSNSNSKPTKPMKNRKLQEMNYFQVRETELNDCFPEHDLISKSCTQISKFPRECDKRMANFSEPSEMNDEDDHDFQTDPTESNFTEESSATSQNSTFYGQEKFLINVDKKNLPCSKIQRKSSNPSTSSEQINVRTSAFHNSVKYNDPESQLQDTRMRNSIQDVNKNQFTSNNRSSINLENSKVIGKSILIRHELSNNARLKEDHSFPSKEEQAIKMNTVDSTNNEHKNKAVCRESLVLSPLSFLLKNQQVKSFTKTDNKKNKLVPLFLPFGNNTDQKSDIQDSISVDDSDFTSSELNKFENAELIVNGKLISKQEDCLTNSIGESPAEFTNSRDSDKYSNVETEEKEDSNSSADSKKVTFSDQISIVKTILPSENASAITPSSTESTKCARPGINKTENEGTVKIDNSNNRNNHKIMKSENAEEPKSITNKWIMEDSSNLDRSTDSWLEESDSSSLELEGVQLTKNGVSEFSTKSIRPKENTSTFEVDDLFSDSPENKVLSGNKQANKEYNKHDGTSLNKNLILPRSSEKEDDENNEFRRKPLNRTHNSYLMNSLGSENTSYSNPTFINNQNNQSGVHINIPVTVCLSENKMYENNSYDDSMGRSLLRNEYGDPFAPIYCPASSEKSGKNKSVKPSFHNISQNHKSNYVQSEYFPTEFSQNPYAYENTQSSSSSYGFNQRSFDKNAAHSFLNEKSLSCNSQNVKSVKRKSGNKSIKDYFPVYKSSQYDERWQPNSDGNVQASGGYMREYPNAFHNQNNNALSVKRKSENQQPFQIFRKDDGIEAYKRSMLGNNLFMPKVSKATKKIKSEAGWLPRLSNLAHNGGNFEMFPNPSQVTAVRPLSQALSYSQEPQSHYNDQTKFFQCRNFYGINQEMAQSQALVPQQAFFKIPQFLPESQVFRPIPMSEVNYGRPTQDVHVTETEEDSDGYEDQEMVQYSSMAYGASESMPSPPFTGEFFERARNYQESPNSIEDDF